MLDQKRRQARARQRGAGGRFIFQVIWFIVAITISFFLVRLLFSNGILSYTRLQQWGIPSSWPTTLIDILLTATIFIVLQVIFTLGFTLGRPSGRQNVSRATLNTYNPEYIDPDDR